jgi:hypothetical protein
MKDDLNFCLSKAIAKNQNISRKSGSGFRRFIMESSKDDFDVVITFGGGDGTVLLIHHGIFDEWEIDSKDDCQFHMFKYFVWMLGFDIRVDVVCFLEYLLYLSGVFNMRTRFL